MRVAGYLSALLGLMLLIVLVLRADWAAMLQSLATAGWQLLWLAPYRLLYFVLYAIGWLILLRPYDPERRAGLGYLLWVATVREGIDRLLPVASVGGGIVGVRLVRWRGLDTISIAASVMTEVLLTLVVVYVFTAMGLLLLTHLRLAGNDAYRHLLAVFLLSLPIPAVTLLLLRHGSLFQRLQGILYRLVGSVSVVEGAAALDRQLRACLHRGWALARVAALQFAGFLSGAFEVWFALRLFGHPIDITAALMLESMTQAVRHLAFIVPAGLGVQEAGLIVFGQMVGISGELALAVSMAKRLREVLCGVPALLSWQWVEARRLRAR